MYEHRYASCWSVSGLCNAASASAAGSGRQSQKQQEIIGEKLSTMSYCADVSTQREAVLLLS